MISYGRFLPLSFLALFGLCGISSWAAQTPSIPVTLTLKCQYNGNQISVEKTYLVSEDDFLTGHPSDFIKPPSSWSLQKEEMTLSDVPKKMDTTDDVSKPYVLDSHGIAVLKEAPCVINKITRGVRSLICIGKTSIHPICSLRIYTMQPGRSNDFIEKENISKSYLMSADSSLMVEKFFGYFVEQGGKFVEDLELVSEYFPRQSLVQFMQTQEGKIAFEDKKMVLKRLVALSKTLASAHEKYNVAHNKIKLGSILVADDGGWKFTRFGREIPGNNNATNDSDKKMVPFWPPEYHFVSTMDKTIYPKAADVYAFAILTAHLMLKADDPRLRVWQHIGIYGLPMAFKITQGLRPFNVLENCPEDACQVLDISAWDLARLEKKISGLPQEFVDGLSRFWHQDLIYRGNATDLAGFLEHMYQLWDTLPKN